MRNRLDDSYLFHLGKKFGYLHASILYLIHSFNYKLYFENKKQKKKENRER